MPSSPAATTARSIHYVGTTRGVERRLLPPTGYQHTLFDVVGLQRALSRPQPGVPAQADPLDVAGHGDCSRAVAEGGRQRRRIRQLSGDVPPRRCAACRSWSSATTVDPAWCRSSMRAARRGVRRGVRGLDAAEGAAHRRTGAPGGAGRRPSRRPRGAARRSSTCRTTASCSPCSAVRSVPSDSTRSRRSWSSELGRPHGPGGVPRRRRTQSGRVPRPVAMAAHGIMYRVLGYEDRMPLVYAAADLMMTRAGAATIAELATVGDAGRRSCRGPAPPRTTRSTTPASSAIIEAAVLIEEADLDVERLVDEITELMSNPDRLAEMSTAAGRDRCSSSQRRARRSHRTGRRVVSSRAAASRSICRRRSGCTSSVSAARA